MPSNNLPFDLTDDSANVWLQSLSHLSSVNSANQLYKVIKQLRSTKSDSTNTLKILIQLTPTALYIISDIESSLQADETKNTDKTQKIKKLCIQLLRNLSLNFYVFSNTSKLADNEKNQAIYMALQIIGYSQRLTTLFHQPPSSTLWKITAELYTFAQSRNIIQQEIKHKIKDFKNLTTIESALKRNLLFSILAPYQYNNIEINALFSISEKYAHLLTLDTADTADTAENKFYWDYANQTSPNIKQQSHKPSNSTISIDTRALTLKLQSTTFSSILKKDTLEDIINRLSGYTKVINSPLPSTFSINHLITGFFDITQYLKKIDNLDKIQQLSSELNGENNTATSNMSLEPMEFEKSHFNKPPPLSSNIDHLLAKTVTVKTLALKDTRFIMAETNPIDCSISDLTLLCSSKPHPELGIIRQIKTINPTGTLHILIEKVAGTPSPQIVSHSKAPDQAAILIQNKDTNASVFIAPCKLSSDAKIKPAIGSSTPLKALIDHTPFYMQHLV